MPSICFPAPHPVWWWGYGLHYLMDWEEYGLEGHFWVLCSSWTWTLSASSIFRIMVSSIGHLEAPVEGALSCPVSSECLPVACAFVCLSERLYQWVWSSVLIREVRFLELGYSPVVDYGSWTVLHLDTSVTTHQLPDCQTTRLISIDTLQITNPASSWAQIYLLLLCGLPNFPPQQHL